MDLFFSLQILFIVKKTTGGKAWIPKWGLTGLTRTQKANRRKNRQEEHQVGSVIFGAIIICDILLSELAKPSKPIIDRTFPYVLLFFAGFRRPPRGGQA